MAANPVQQAQQQQAISERSEIHKSCRAVEVVVNVFNDYSEAARAVVSLQKKLAKALRDAAGLKATGEIAGNALNASAGMFEALSEVDAKFAKIAEKECDAITGEVRKWFKKLGKDEKVHDDKVASVNNRIKAAGISYEKKAKRNTFDAVDEHARYISLLASLGPELSQEKYNHSLSVSQRNTAVTNGVAATIARIADAEWVRATEYVRRFAPLIGPVGEWRSYCEGGWTGAVPGPLPDENSAHQQPQNQQAPQTLANAASSDALASSQPKASQDRGSPAISEKSSDDPRRIMSLANLASFPDPPGHFPLPPVHMAKPSTPSTPPPESPIRHYPSSPTKANRLMSQSLSSSDLSTLARVEESSNERETTPALTDTSRPSTTPSTALATPTATTVALPTFPRPRVSNDLFARQPSPTRSPFVSRPYSPTKASTQIVREPEKANVERSAASNTAVTYSSRPVSLHAASSSGTLRKGDYLEDRDFSPTMASDKSRSLDSVAGPRQFERTDTVKSSGSAVSQSRDKYGRTTGPASAPPRDLPRLQTSVSEIASKFQSTTPPETVRRAPLPSTNDDVPSQRFQDPAGVRRAYDTAEATPAQRSYDVERPNATSAVPRPTSLQLDDLQRRRLRIAELEELERREYELEERARDRRIREDERTGLGRLREEDETSGSIRFDSYRRDAVPRSAEPPSHARNAYREAEPRRFTRSPEPLNGDNSQGPDKLDGYMSDPSRPRIHRPLSQISGALKPPTLTSHYSFSATNLAAPTNTLMAVRSSSDQPFPPSSPDSGPGLRTHPGNCQCPACTVERAAINPHGSPTAGPGTRERKTSGWRRRLSMPVIIPFANDGKKDRGISGGKPLH